MKRILMAVGAFVALMVPAGAMAATVTNADDTAHTLIISEGGNQSELTIGPGETVEICPSGCFVTMPNGDREALTGNEKLSIEASRSVFE